MHKDGTKINCGHGIQEMIPLRSEISRPEKTYVRFQIKNSSLNAVDLEREKLNIVYLSIWYNQSRF